jgi:hypothetical protein
MGTYHAKDMRASKLPGVFYELLEPAPRSLRLLDWGQLRRAGLALRELGTDQVQDRGYSFPDLTTVDLPGVPVLDQLIQVLLGVDLENCKRNRTLFSAYQKLKGRQAADNEAAPITR